MINSITKDELVKRFELQQEYLGDSKSVNLIIPVVSVTIATYQHANFIEVCLKSILSQKTTFPFEVIIGEDASTDGTKEICMKYAEQFPDKIRLFLRDRNLSQFYHEGKFVCRFNGVWNRMSARGKYIAWCEGDDYWTDPYKLQKQVDILEKYPNLSLCVGGYKIHNTLTGKEREIVLYKDTRIKEGYDFDLNDFYEKGYVKTLTVLFRQDMYLNFKDKLFEYKTMRDTHLFYHLLKMGNGYYIPEILGVYNVHHGGINSLRPVKELYHTSYYISKELYEANKDDYTRRRYLINTLSLLSHDIYYMKISNRTARLIRELYPLFSSISEIRYVFYYLMPPYVRVWGYRFLVLTGLRKI